MHIDNENKTKSEMRGYEMKSLMNMSRRANQRIPIHLEAVLVSNQSNCFAFIENISECGIYVKTSCIEHTEYFKPDTKANLIFRLPSGQFLQLKCKEIWLKKNVSKSLLEHIGMEIINPSQEYKEFYKAVKFGKLIFSD